MQEKNYFNNINQNTLKALCQFKLYYSAYVIFSEPSIVLKKVYNSSNEKFNHCSVVNVVNFFYRAEQVT